MAAYNENIKLLNRKILMLLIAAFLTLIIFFSQFNRLSEFKYWGDASSYIAMAEGRREGIPSYHARRILHPWIVGKLRPFVGTDIAFIIIGTISLFLFLSVFLITLHYDMKQPLIVCIGLIFLPYLFYLYSCLYTQILFFIFLSSIYNLLLIRKRYGLSIFILFFMFLTRDETIIIAISFISALLINIFSGLKNRNYYFYIFSTIAVIILGGVIVTYNMRTSSNMHHMSVIFCYFLRLPLFAIRNFTGIGHWVDTYKNLPFYTHTPIISFEAPIWLRRISIIKQIGIYDWNPMNVFQTWLLILSSLGTAPTILLYFLKKRGFKIISSSLAFNTILFYGCIIFTLAPVAGPSDLRYYNLAWPILVIAIALLKQIRQIDKKIFARIIICHILSAWFLYIWLNYNAIAIIINLIVTEILLHLYTWRMLSSISERLSFESF